MNIVTYLLKKFFYEEMFNTTVMITLSIVITTLQMNVISSVTANIIESVNNKNPKMTYSFFYMFIFISIISLLLNHNYIYFQN